MTVGRASSTAPASLENLLRMVPAGEESKKEQGARSSRENMSEWRRMDARMHTCRGGAGRGGRGRGEEGGGRGEGN